MIRPTYLDRFIDYIMWFGIWYFFCYGFSRFDISITLGSVQISDDALEEGGLGECTTFFLLYLNYIKKPPKQPPEVGGLEHQRKNRLIFLLALFYGIHLRKLWYW